MKDSTGSRLDKISVDLSSVRISGNANHELTRAEISHFDIAAEERFRQLKEDLDIIKTQPKILTVYSQAILEAVRHIAPFYPPQVLTGEAVHMPHPFPVLMHHYEELRHCERQCLDESPRTENDQDTKEKGHNIQKLLDFLAPVRTKIVLPAKERLSRDEPVVTFGTLWFMYKPGIDVYWREPLENLLIGGVVYNVIRETDEAAKLRRAPRPGLRVLFFFLEVKESKVTRVKAESLIEHFPGEELATNLALFPAEILDSEDRGKMRQKCQERGSHAYKLFRGGHTLQNYSGSPYGQFNIKVRFLESVFNQVLSSRSTRTLVSLSTSRRSKDRW